MSVVSQGKSRALSPEELTAFGEAVDALQKRAIADVGGPRVAVTVGAVLLLTVAVAFAWRAPETYRRPAAS